MRTSPLTAACLALPLVAAQTQTGVSPNLAAAVAGLQSIVTNVTAICVDTEASEQALSYYADMIVLATAPSYQSFFCGEERSLYSVIRDALLDSLADLPGNGSDLPSAVDIIFSTFDAAEAAGIAVYPVDDVESLERGGLPRNLYSQIITSDPLTELAASANAPGNDTQAEFRASAEATPFGGTYAFDDVSTFAVQIFTETTLARYLETSDGGETYRVVCGGDSGDPVVKTLWDGNLFNNNVPIPGPDGAQINFGRNADTDALELTDTTDEVASMVLGCMFNAEEVYHGGLHFIEGSFQNSITAGVFDDDAFVKSVLNIEQDLVQAKYGEVRFLTVAPGIVWEGGLPPAVTKAVLIPFISGALLDFTSINPLAKIPEDRLVDFAIPLREIYENIRATDFGYGTDTYRMYVATDTMVDAPTNNLLQLQMMVALLHTDTFVWQLMGAHAPSLTGFMSLPVTAAILNSVVFPDLEFCLSTTWDVSKAYEELVSNTYDEDSPSEGGRAALETYASWLADYRASGLTGIASAFSDTECMSSTTWV